MVSLAKLNSILILFCFCFAFATYSPLARWLLTLEHLEDNNFVDLTNNGNLFQPQTNYGQDVVAEASCGSWHIKEFNSGLWCGAVNSITSSTSQYGVSVWMKNGGLTDGATPIWMATGSGDDFTLMDAMAYYGEENIRFSEDKNVPFTEGTWLFLVFYWTKVDEKFEWNIISPGVGHLIIDEINAFQGEKVCVGYSSKETYYYEIQFFTTATVDSQIVTLYDANNHGYIATTSSCSCGSDYCHPEMDCLVTDTCQCPALCTCSDIGECTACKDTDYDTKDNCKCKIGYVLEGDSCVLGNFYIDLPDNCVAGTSKTVCSQCEENYFLYDLGSDVACVACETSCSNCNADNCYLCAGLTVKDGDTCRVDSYGYKRSFSYPNKIIINFTHPLPANYVIKNLKATKTTGEDISTEAWSINSEVSTLSKIQIDTDLNSSQLPVKFNFDFEVSS